MPELPGSRTHEHLMEAFAAESQANRRYLWFAQRADVEGYPDVAALFRSVAESETGHALGLLDFLADLADPISGAPIGDTVENLRAAIENESQDSSQRYPVFASVAREEGFDEIAEWFESLARAEHGHARRFAEGLDALGRTGT